MTVYQEKDKKTGVILRTITVTEDFRFGQRVGATIRVEGRLRMQNIAFDKALRFTEERHYGENDKFIDGTISFHDPTTGEMLKDKNGSSQLYRLELAKDGTVRIVNPSDEKHGQFVGTFDFGKGAVDFYILGSDAKGNLFGHMYVAKTSSVSQTISAGSGGGGTPDGLSTQATIRQVGNEHVLSDGFVGFSGDTLIYTSVGSVLKIDGKVSALIKDKEGKSIATLEGGTISFTPAGIMVIDGSTNVYSPTGNLIGTITAHKEDQQQFAQAGRGKISLIWQELKVVDKEGFTQAIREQFAGLSDTGSRENGFLFSEDGSFFATPFFNAQRALPHLSSMLNAQWMHTK